MNPSRTIRIPHPHINRNRMSKCDIFDLVSRVLPWNRTIKSETGNLVENLKGNNFFKMLRATIISKFKNVCAKML